MNYPPSLRRRLDAYAFTLIELLVVISIIAVLAGLLLPVIGNVMVKAKGVETKNTAVQVVTAIKSYQTEYGNYPIKINAGDTAVDVTYLPNVSNAALFSVLQATNTPANDNLNTRRVRYFEAKDAKSLTAPKAGFVPVKGVSAKDTLKNGVSVGDLMDSFGMRFAIRMDGGYTDCVSNPYPPGESPPSAAANDTGPDTAGAVLRFGVIVWSYGNDNLYGKKGTATNSDIGDDVLSWQ